MAEAQRIDVGDKVVHDGFDWTVERLLHSIFDGTTIWLIRPIVPPWGKPGVSYFATAKLNLADLTADHG